jgi:hypothetical protein
MIRMGVTSSRMDSAIPLTDRGPTVDCQGVWRDLVSRADKPKAELDRTENLVRTNRVPPGHCRKLLATHGLEAWDAYCPAATTGKAPATSSPTTRSKVRRTVRVWSGA